MIKRQVTLALVVLCQLVLVSSRARLVQPAARATIWRQGYKTPRKHDDDMLNCGGLEYQISRGYKCGLCGDRYDGIRENETGGRFAKGQIAANYIQGQEATIEVLLKDNKKGYFEFKICPRNDDNVRETQECFNLYNLSLAVGSGTKYYVGSNSGRLNVNVYLPSDLTCQYCVLQWRYHTGNSWGAEANGTACEGCGMQEEFYGCSDIRILPTGSINPDDQYVTFELIEVPERPAAETTTVKPVRVNNLTGCRAVGVWANIPGHDSWCSLHCPLDNCPTSYCVCSK